MTTRTPHHESGRSSIARSIRVDLDHISHLLDRLDGDNADSNRANRSTERFSYRTATVAHIQQPGDAHFVAFRVPMRNLSNGGAAFLHGGFLHNGTQCILQLITPQGSWNDVQGRATRCRYLDGNIHEVAVKFNEEIDAALYCAGAVCPSILLAEDDAMSARLVQVHLKKLNAMCDHAIDGAVTFQMATSKPYDLILMDMDMPEMDGFEVTRQLRKQGYSGIIVAVTAMTQPSDREQCLQAGCDQYLPKPYSFEDLAKLCRDIGEEPLYSSLSGDSGVLEAVEAFVSSLVSEVRMIEALIASNDLERLRGCIRRLKGEGTSFGFAAITEQAECIENLLLESPIDTAREELRRLIKMCLKARSSMRSQSAR